MGRALLASSPSKLVWMSTKLSFSMCNCLIHTSVGTESAVQLPLPYIATHPSVYILCQCTFGFPCSPRPPPAPMSWHWHDGNHCIWPCSSPPRLEPHHDLSGHIPTLLFILLGKRYQKAKLRPQTQAGGGLWGQGTTHLGGMWLLYPAVPHHCI